MALDPLTNREAVGVLVEVLGLVLDQHAEKLGLAIGPSNVRRLAELRDLVGPDARGRLEGLSVACAVMEARATSHAVIGEHTKADACRDAADLFRLVCEEGPVLESAGDYRRFRQVVLGFLFGKPDSPGGLTPR
jgi:hypothetical protein